MQSTLNTELLASMLKSKRGKKGLRAVSDEIGDVSAPTLSRIEQGKIPDVDTFIKICKWLDVSTDTFIASDSRANPLSNHQHVVAHLRADRELPPDTLNMLVTMIDLAYKNK
ncbi:helix-turn-helix domain-containing protein [Daejeonella lutea]|uniref:Helix-turn-helix n=1 Tax=Daejeonella lutea TaxID=572036 RepID=A0A1T5CX60_9SPHI|nr:helix-turn-helix transcriptional regulator [Daejeonella lutea]SKB64052.1 Helix-turn-helix [Daejeonella lutea]